MDVLKCPHCGKDFGDSDLAEYKRKQEASKLLELNYPGLIKLRSLMKKFFYVATLILFPISAFLPWLVENPNFFRFHLAGILLIGVTYLYCDIRIEIVKNRLVSNLRP
jgi:hypothetical protein